MNHIMMIGDGDLGVGVVDMLMRRRFFLHTLYR